jgi:hypothetical protein
LSPSFFQAFSDSILFRVPSTTTTTTDENKSSPTQKQKRKGPFAAVGCAQMNNPNLFDLLKKVDDDNFLMYISMPTFKLE